MIRVNLIQHGWFAQRPITSIVSRPCSEIVTSFLSQSFTGPTYRKPICFPGRLSPQFQIVQGEVADLFAWRILARLSKLELKATAEEYDDLRVAWLCVLRASEGNAAPWPQAFWEYYGASPEKLIPFFCARAQANNTPFFPDSLLPLRYTKDWEETFLHGLELAERSAKKPAHRIMLIRAQERKLP